MMEKFHYTLPDGYKIELPKFENVPMGLVRKTRKLERVDQVFTMLEDFCTEEDLAHLDNVSRDEFDAILKAWTEASSVTEGESSASSIS